jgi:4-amino-4-deoxy-L-arabinose transferase-like glycosyltransferase
MERLRFISMTRDKWLLLIIVLTGACLRLFRLDTLPPSLYWDEAAIGYDAYSIATTGLDMHGKQWLQPFFYSYGDYKAPVYIWLASLSATLLGAQDWVIRLPSALAGIGMILVLYCLTKELTGQRRTALIVALLTAVSPWSLHFSRVAFEGHVGLFFYTTSLLLFIKASKKPVVALLAGLSAAAALYSYVSLRFVLPPSLLMLGLFLMYTSKSWKRPLSALLITFTLSIMLALPLFLSADYESSNQFRMSNKNVLNNTAFVEHQNQARQLAGNSLFSRLVYHRYIYMIHDLSKNILSHADFRYIFFTGDANLRHGTGNNGLLSLALFPFFLAGIVKLARKPSLLFLLTSWWLLGVLPAALVYETPHSLRSLNAMPVLLLIPALGISALLTTKRLRLLFISTSALFFLMTGLFLHDYFTHYETRSAIFWQHDYKVLTQALQEAESNVESIYLADIDRYYLYYLFFHRISPAKFQEGFKNQKDSVIDNYHFNLSLQELLAITDQDSLVVIPVSWSYPENAFSLDGTIYSNSEPAFYLLRPVSEAL